MRAAVYGLGLTWLAAACGGSGRPTEAARAGAAVQGPLVVPLRDPLLEPDPSVAVRRSRAGQPLWLRVDDEDPASTIDGAILVARGFFEPADISRKPTTFIPQMFLGDRRFTDVLVRAVPKALRNTIGQSVLGDSPWELDWDLGTLTLDAPAWPLDRPGVVRVPLRRIEGRDIVDLRTERGTFPMGLGTARPANSSIGEPVGELGGSMESVGRSLSTHAWLGELSLGLSEFSTTIREHLGRGTLGLDILSQYDLYVVPGRELWLAPRRGVAETAVARIARWPHLRGCDSPGCVTVCVVPAETSSTVAFAIERPLEGPELIVMTCTEDNLPFVSRAATFAHAYALCGGNRGFDLAKASPYSAGHLIAQLPKGAHGTVTETFDGLLPCPTLRVVDIVPLEPSQIEDGDPIQVLAPGGQRPRWYPP